MSRPKLPRDKDGNIVRGKILVASLDTTPVGREAAPLVAKESSVAMNFQCNGEKYETNGATISDALKEAGKLSLKGRVFISLTGKTKGFYIPVRRFQNMLLKPWGVESLAKRVRGFA